nr:hypothetical protein [Tanacetum cinerariifolium]
MIRLMRRKVKAIESAFQSSMQGDKKPSQYYGRGSSSRGARGGKSFESRVRTKNHVVSRVPCISEKSHLGKVTLSSVAFARKTSMEIKIVVTKEILNTLIVTSLVIVKIFVGRRTNKKEINQKKNKMGEINVRGLPQINEIEGVYEGCALGKYQQKPFPQGVTCGSREILKCVHTGLCGPMRNPSHGDLIVFRVSCGLGFRHLQVVSDLDLSCHVVWWYYWDVYVADRVGLLVEVEWSKGVTPSVVDMTIEMGKHNSLDDTTVSESFPPLSTPVNTAGNAPGKSSYANITSKPSGKKVNVCTLFTPEGNGIDVVVPVDFIRAVSKYGLVRSMFSSSTGLFSFQFSSMDGLDAMLENGSWLIRNNPLILKTWNPVENLLKEEFSTVPVWVKLYGVPVTAFSEDGLSAIATKLENIVVAMPKITREGHYTCSVLVVYEWKPPRCSSCKDFGHIHEECPKNTGAGEKKTMKKPSQTSRGVLVGPKIGVEPTIEVSNSNPFDVFNSVDNDMKFGTNWGTTNLVNNEATSSGSSFMNIDNDGEFAIHTPISEKIVKIERYIFECKLRLLDNDENPLVPSGIVESDSEVKVVFDETANLKILTSGKDECDKGYGTDSLLEQWRDSYPDNDDYDPYDDDMYENHDLSEHLQSICDDLDITIHDRKKKYIF